MKNIYVDNAATTRVKDEVLEAIMPYFQEYYGNASSSYSLASKSREAINESREAVRELINAKHVNEIYFTSGGTESDNWAIRGVAKANKNKGKHIITSKIEHDAVLHVCEDLEKNGYDVTYLDVDEYGRIDIKELENAIREDTILITIMFANNEVGTLMPIKEIGQIADKHNIYFHTDAVQAVGNIPVDVEDLKIDLMSMSGHKHGGPKGIGALYIRAGVKIDPIMIGGAQERSRRGGTENVPGIVGFAKALELAYANLDEESAYLKKLRDRFIERATTEIDHVLLNGHPTDRLPGNANVSVEYIEGESMLLHLDVRGISASSGSACTSGSLEPSHVLLAMGRSHETAHGSLRVTFSEENTLEDVDYIVDSLKEIVDVLRKMSPLYQGR